MLWVIRDMSMKGTGVPESGWEGVKGQFSMAKGQEVMADKANLVQRTVGN